MLSEPHPTSYDLKFRVGPFPVRVHPFFWLTTLLLGSRLLQSDRPVLYLSLWVVIVFGSILVHELGHAIAFRRFGSDARIWLYWFGGLAVSSYSPTTPGRRIVIALAGPVAGFLLAGIVYALDRSLNISQQSRVHLVVISQLIYVNLVWNILNLLPIVPLDGSRVRAFLMLA